MSGFNARKAPNVSQYLANLNQISGPQDLSPQTDVNIDDGLEFLTNAEFFDFDQFNPSSFDDRTHQTTADPSNSAQYAYDYQSYPATSLTSPNAATAPSPPALHGQYPPQPHHFPSSTSPTTAHMRKASVSVPSIADLEEASRMAAEEDKRRRNTAASARFRVKKKQREQALEKQAKEMSEKVQQLEGKVQQLEMENKWLKELITEKSDGRSFDDAVSHKSEKESGERSRGSRTDGVGTSSTADPTDSSDA